MGCFAWLLAAPSPANPENSAKPIVLGPSVGPAGKFMKRVSLAGVLLCLLASVRLPALTACPAFAQKPFETIPVSQIHPGMKGVAYTVFQGTKPEAMDVEVLGILQERQRPEGRHHSGAPGRRESRIHRRSGGHERQPGVFRWEAGGRHGVPHRRIFQGADCRRHADRRNARDQRDGSSPERTFRTGQSRPLRSQQDFGARNVQRVCEISPTISSRLKLLWSSAAFPKTRFSTSRHNLPRRNCAGDGRGFGQRRQTAGTAGTWFGDQRDPGARRYGYFRDLHRHLHGRATPAGLRPSLAAVRHGGSADDQGDGAGHTAVAAECFQDCERHRDRSARLCRTATPESWANSARSRT